MAREPRAGFWAGVLIVVVVLIFLLVLGLLGVFGIFTIVPAGAVGVQDTFGNVDPTALQSGFHFKAPWTGVISMSTQTNAVNMYGPDEAPSLTIEGVTIVVDCTTLYHLDPAKAPDVYRTLGVHYVDTIVAPEIRGELRSEIAKYKAEDIYSNERGQIANNVISGLNAKLNPRGIYVDDFIIRKVILPDSIQTAINAKQSMQQQIQQKQFEVDVARAEADRKRQEAQGIADANKIIAGSLSENYLRWYWIENLAGKNNTIYVTDGTGVPTLVRDI